MSLPIRPAAGVAVVTGDTKVVDRGKGDGVYVNTAGIGEVPEGVDNNLLNAVITAIVIGMIQVRSF